MTSEHERETTGRLTVTTWNLNGVRGLDVDRVAAHVRATGSDVLALQEVQRSQARTLAARLEARSLHWSFKHWPLTGGPEGMALVGVTCPVEDVQTSAITARWRLASWRRRIVQVARVRSAPQLRLVNVHLTPHAEGAANRERELERILSAPGIDRRSIIAGDFNAEPGTVPVEQMRLHGYTTGEKGPTKWRGVPSDRPPEREIDYVWASEGLTVDHVTVPRHGDDGFATFPTLSDHLPVTARVTASW